MVDFQRKKYRQVVKWITTKDIVLKRIRVIKRILDAKDPDKE